MADKITTLKGEVSRDEIYPNIKRENIPNSAVNADKIEDGAIITIKLADGAIITAKLADAVITTNKIAEGAVTTNKISNAAVTTDKINNKAVTTDKLEDAAVTSLKLANGSVNVNKIGDGSVTTDKIVDSNVTTAKIADGNVTTDKLANGAVTGDKIANAFKDNYYTKDETYSTIETNALLNTKLNLADVYYYVVNNINDPIPVADFNKLVNAKIGVILYDDKRYYLTTFGTSGDDHYYVFKTLNIENGTMSILTVFDTNRLLSPAVETACQEILVSGSNLKTVNGSSLLGSGDLVVGSTLYLHCITFTKNNTRIAMIVLRQSNTALTYDNIAQLLYNNGMINNANLYSASGIADTNYFVNGLFSEDGLTIKYSNGSTGGGTALINVSVWDNIITI